MAAKNSTIAIAIATIFVLTLCSGGAVAQGPTSAPEPSAVVFGPSAEAPAPDCLTNLLNMSDCLTYVTAGSNLTKPDKACCPELAGLVESSPQCLCLLLDKNATSSYGIDIDMSKALNLPNVCKVETPPISLCSVINGSPVEAPTGSDAPMSSPGLAPEATASSPSNGGTNGGSNIAASATGVASLAALAIAFLPTLFGV
ncbi:hypothetical protein COLO4_25284 [Corchorus olitorius]|uniref:Bifunctional inhibitor/plant lipid transfer protein/seed storage helical domain-containing protein n=1 Tax=Corchorus olitorius TaxID=93759 RepID=A0A1R3I3N1_9ROSI|nr:hypothetical protein COLO4_25284 [Corchorus olitorius]